MVIKPRVRGFICTTAHPLGCEKNVYAEAEYAKEKLAGKNGPKRVLVVGSSAGYGLTSRITAAVGYNAATVGVFFERPPSGGKTGSAGWYNNLAFEKLASENGLSYKSINADAFSNEAKDQAVQAIKEIMGQVDLVVYSLGAPRRKDPETGEVYHSVIKPIGSDFTGKTVDFHTGNVFEMSVSAASEEEVAGSVKVMGGEDWKLWIEKLSKEGVLADNAVTVAYSYVGPQLTHDIYKSGSIGKAKEDLEEKCAEISKFLQAKGGKAFVSVNKSLVTQSSAAIPVLPLYISIIFKVMKENGTHEECMHQIVRLYRDMLYANGMPESWDNVPVDEAGRIRIDELEMNPEAQKRVDELWDKATTENIWEISDLKGYNDNFYSLFGFGVDGVDYDADVEI